MKSSIKERNNNNFTKAKKQDGFDSATEVQAVEPTNEEPEKHPININWRPILITIVIVLAAIMCSLMLYVTFISKYYVLANSLIGHATTFSILFIIVSIVGIIMCFKTDENLYRIVVLFGVICLLVMPVKLFINELSFVNPLTQLDVIYESIEHDYNYGTYETKVIVKYTNNSDYKITGIYGRIVFYQNYQFFSEYDSRVTFSEFNKGKSMTATYTINESSPHLYDLNVNSMGIVHYMNTAVIYSNNSLVDNELKLPEVEIRLK